MIHLLALTGLLAVSLPIQAASESPSVPLAVFEAGPDDSPGLRLQLPPDPAGKVVWTGIYGDEWRRLLRGALSVRASVRICSNWGTRQQACDFRDGLVQFHAPVPRQAGGEVRGSLWYRGTSDSGLPFAAPVRAGRLNP